MIHSIVCLFCDIYEFLFGDLWIILFPENNATQFIWLLLHLSQYPFLNYFE